MKKFTGLRNYSFKNEKENSSFLKIEEYVLSNYFERTRQFDINIKLLKNTIYTYCNYIGNFVNKGHVEIYKCKINNKTKYFLNNQSSQQCNFVYIKEDNILLCYYYFSSDDINYIENLNLFEKRKDYNINKFNITLGTDPEFEVIENGKIISLLNRKDYTVHSTVGKDGSGNQLEIRPSPGNTPEELISHIEEIIKTRKDEQWSLKGKKYSLGGHIHIGGINSLSNDFLSLLDYFLKPLMSLQPKSRKKSYGKLHKFEYKRYSDDKFGFEYRSLPVTWLADKEFALVTLKIIKLLAETYYSGIDIITTGIIYNDLIKLGIGKKNVDIYFNKIKYYKNNEYPDSIQKSWLGDIKCVE